MHNAYFSSTLLLSLKSKGSLSFSFNDYSTSSLLNERFDRTPLSCCSCCEVAAHNNIRVPINTSYLYGLRQSTLILCSPYKRLIVGGKDRIYAQFPIHDLNRASYEVSCSIRKKNGNEGFGRRRKGRFRRMVSEEKRERYWLGGVDDAEAVISLLSEEVSEEYLVGRERNEIVAKRVEVDKSEDHDAKFYRGKKNKVEVEKKGRYEGEYFRGAKKTVVSNLLESDSKCKFELARIKSWEEEFGRNEGREAIARGDNPRERTKSSSCSSYYSLSSAGDYGSDDEDRDKDEGFVEESLSGFSKDSGRSEEDSYKAQVVEEFSRCNIEGDVHDEVPEKRYNAARSHVEWDCRKKSEKKLTEIAVEETNSRKQSSQIHLRMDRTGKTDCGKASTSRKQFNDTEERSTLAVNLDKGTTKLYSQMGIQETNQSRSKWQEVTEIQEMHGSNIETTSESQKQFSNKEENMVRGERFQTVGIIAGNNNLRRDSQQLTKTSEILNVDTKKVPNLLRHSRMKVQKEDASLVQSSVQQTNGQHKQRSERIIEKIDLRREPEYYSETLETHDTNLKEKSAVQSETRLKDQDENSKLVSISYPEAKEQRSQRDYEHHQRTQSRKGSQDITRVSVVSTSDVETYIESQRTSGKRVINQQSTLTSVVKPAGETRERHNQPDEKVMQSKLRKEAQKPARLSSSHEQTSEESSGLQASINLVSQARVRKINVEEEEEEEEEEERISQAILMPTPSQLVARGSLHVGSTSGVAIQEVSIESSESGASALYTNSGGTTQASHNESYVRGRQGETYDEHLTHEDALGSAHRLEESSMQFVGEFVERAKHEVSTSEMRKENIDETKVVYEGEKQWKKDSGPYASKDFQLKGCESRWSSGGSGAKGPSDDMWGVTDPFVQPSQAEALEGNQAAGNAIVKKRGRSLWNIMADIVRLRWGSHAETANSAARSDEKSPYYESVSSETWFSGRESDKNSDENMKRERRNMPQDATQQQEKSFTRSQGETSDIMASENKERKLEADLLSSSSIIESGSTSKRISSNFEEKNLDLSAEGNSFQSTISGLEVVPSSSQLPAGSTRRPAVEAISETVKIHVSEIGSMVQLAQPFNSRLTEVSGSPGKEGELKKRKLQRNKQVLKDRFDEWEEAYKIENEQRKFDEMFMSEALLEAKKAADTWEVPVGAVLVQHGKIIARGCNLVEELRDSTAHAEMICIREASNVLRTWRLADTTLYVTLEPCPMCAGAILQARINTIVWGAPNKLLGADGSWFRLFPDGGEGRDGTEASDKPAAPVHPFHPKMTIRRGVLAAECADVMQQFFQLRRRKEKTPRPPSCLPITNQPSKILTKMQHMFHILFCL